MHTIKVKPWGEGQSDHVVIDAAQFDPTVHVPFEEPAAQTDETVPELTPAPARRTRKPAGPAAQE